MIKYPSIETFIMEHLRYKQHWNKKHITISDAIWQTLDNDTFLNGIVYATGSLFKVFETTNFGWIVFGPDTKTADGNIPFRRIVKY